MKATFPIGANSHSPRLLLWTFLIQLAVLVPSSFGGPHSAEQSNSPGPRMFRQGILPSGGPMQAAVSADGAVPGATFTCQGCHLRSGLGGLDENLYIPAISGPRLFQPVMLPAEKRILERNNAVATAPRRRPAYTDATLARAIRDGLDSAGRPLHQAMPRYRLNDGEMASLISYLKTLSSQFSPGATDSLITFATVITDDVPQADRDAMLLPLLGFIDSRNRMARLSQRVNIPGKGNFALMRDDMMISAGQSLSLSVWQLKGPPETWRKQLENFYEREPVFALIGGISTGPWQPIHDFCEENGIPSLFPAANFPDVSAKGWYTMYVSKGYYDEGEAAAAYLAGLEDKVKGRAILEIVRDMPEGRALSKGFRDAWQNLGHEPPVTLMLEAGEEVDDKVVQQLLAKEKPVAVLLWGAKTTTLESFLGSPDRPEMAFISRAYVGKALSSLDRRLRDFTYMTVRDEPDQGQLLAQILTLALMDLRGNYYRDYLLDVIGMMGEVELRPLGRPSLSSIQRYLTRAVVLPAH